jgi:GAF domain-containing protein
MCFPVPPEEEARLRVLRSLDLLYSNRERAFDELCVEAATRLSAPIALISLMDADQQWFKARCGLSAHGTSRDVAFCAYTIMSDQVLVVPDARLDPRFASNPLVTGWPHIVAYAGAPLLYGKGIRIGTMCVIDTKPREFNATDRAVLVELADRISGEIWVRSYREIEVIDA